MCDPCGSQRPYAQYTLGMTCIAFIEWQIVNKLCIGTFALVPLKFSVYFSITNFSILYRYFYKTVISVYLLHTLFYLNNFFYLFINIILLEYLSNSCFFSLYHPKRQNPSLKLFASLIPSSSQYSPPLYHHNLLSYLSQTPHLSLEFLS